MKAPPHPGLSVRDDCLAPHGLSVTAAARLLGVTRQAINNVVNGKSAISADMAIRLDLVFGGGAETWMNLQSAYDLAQARQRVRGPGLRRYAARPAELARKGAATR